MINALTTAQKNHQQAQTKLNSQLSAVTKIVQKLIANRKRDQHVAVAIKDII
jgi:ferredoxin-thioredoxin reductase catalytic subunit